jgi:PGF-CTERM protein
MKVRIPILVTVFVVLSVAGATGVAAQEVETEIQFEDEVVVDEETTVTYVANVVETPVETNVEVGLTLLIDGEVVRTQTTEEEVFDGAELRTEFAHTFDSSGEKEVTVDSVTEVFGQRIADSTTETVTVMAEDNGTEDGVSNGTDEGSSDDNTGGSSDDGDMEEGTGDEIGDGTEGGVSNQTDSTTDRMEDGAEDNRDDNGTDSDTEDAEDGTSEELPGFGAVAALVSLAAVAVYTNRRRG